ncbi:hypothetical protein ACQ4PT_052007 [Festuca glaucescens]
MGMATTGARLEQGVAVAVPQGREWEEEGVGLEQTECPSGCICDQPPNWKTEELQLSCLWNIEIRDWRGTENEIAFVERLFSWATALKEVTVTFHQSITESIGRDLCQPLLSFSRPETCMEFRTYGGLFKKAVHAPED